MEVLRRFWNEEDGYILSTELVLVGSLLVVGVIGGMTVMRDSLVGEMQDLSMSVSSLDQSFSVVGIVEGRNDLGRNDIAFAANGFGAGSGLTEFGTGGRVLSYSAGSAFLDNPEKDMSNKRLSTVEAAPNAGLQTLATKMSPEARQAYEQRLAARARAAETETR